MPMPDGTPTVGEILKKMEENQASTPKKNPGENGAVGFVIALVIIAGLFLGGAFDSCDSGSSSSGKKWSELSEIEKENARTAAEIYDYIHKND